MPIDFIPTGGAAWCPDALARLALISPAELSSLARGLARIDTGRALLTQRNLRQVLERIDLLLRVGGDLLVSCDDMSDMPKRGRRTGTQIQYELACVFPDCYRLASRSGGTLQFEKLALGRDWSAGSPQCALGYITDGKHTAMIRRTLDAIERLNGGLGPSAVIVAGPLDALKPLQDAYPRIHLVGDYRHDDIRGPINRKKGLIIDAATQENLILAHDRFFFDDGFWSRLGAHGNYFDFYNCRHCSVDHAPEEIEVTGGYGYHRWPISSFSALPRSGTSPKDFTNPHFYNNGGLYIGKLKWFRGGRWPMHLHWGDIEDVHFTKRCELDGAVWRHDWANRVFTNTRRMGFVRPLRADQKLRIVLKNAISRIGFAFNHIEREVR